MKNHRLEDLKSATADLAVARQSLAEAKFCARNSMDNNLAFANSVEHTAYHAWLRAGAALNNAH